MQQSNILLPIFKTTKNTLNNLTETPKKTFAEFLDYCVYQTEASPEVLITAYIYLERAIQSRLFLNWVCPERINELFGVCLNLALKFIEENEAWELD